MLGSSLRSCTIPVRRSGQLLFRLSSQLLFNAIKELLRLTKEGDKQMAVLLKKNYALERLPDIKQRGDSTVGAILQLNVAGRRYLVQDGSSILKGVEVLSAVSDEMNCVFLHLLENPRLCDRSTVEETANASPEGSRESASPANHNGKREQDQTQKGKETRRRRA
jgi:hypothetical protein